MEEANAAQAPEPQSELPDVTVLHDTLYEVVASGVGRGTRERIEAFLHEHARRPKERAEFVAFFEAQGLSLPDAPSGFAEPTLSEISMGSLSLSHLGDEPRPLSLDVVRELAEETNPRVPIGQVEIAGGTPRVHTMLVPWAILMLVIAACGAGAYWGYHTLTALQTDLRAAEHRGDESRRVIQALEHRAQELEDRAAGIQSSVAATGALIERMDQKSDLLLERLPEPKPRRWSRPRPIESVETAETAP